MALLAGEGRIQFVVADKAVGHVGEDAGRAHVLGLLNPVVTGGAVIGCVEVRGGPRVEIPLAGDGRAQDWRNVAELRMNLMVEFVDLALGGRFYGAAARVTGRAHGGGRKIVILCPGAGADGLMAGGTDQLQRQMAPVREGLLRTGNIGQKNSSD